MDAVVWILIGLAVVVAVVLIVRAVRAARARRDREASGPEDIIGDVNKPSADALRALANGDVVEHLGHKWFVRGRLELDEAGYRWTEHLLDDAEGRRWVSVEDDERFEASLWRSIPLGDIEQGEVGDRDVIAGGVAYRLQERGEAQFTASGATGTAETGRCEYADYKSVDGKLLGFERFGSGWEISLGEVVQPWELTVYPGSDRAAES